MEQNETNFIECGRYLMDGVPVSQVRHSFNGKRTFYNNKFVKKKKHVLQQLHIQKRMSNLVTSGVPIKISLVYIFPRPQRLKRKKDPPGLLPHVSKPDIDNIDKFYLDCLTGIAFADDNQIFQIESKKLYCSFDYETKKEGWTGAIAHIYTTNQKEFSVQKALNPDFLPW